jgi:ferredoxin
MPRLTVDPIACRAHGLCAELLPEVVDLDEWGYPILRPKPVSNAAARRAIAACPALALSVVSARGGS